MNITNYTFKGKCINNRLLFFRSVNLLHSADEDEDEDEDDPALKVVRHRVTDCEENDCVRLPCENGGVCSSGDSVGGRGFVCQCGEEFTGQRALWSIDHQFNQQLYGMKNDVL